ncbi:MAG: DNA mismatch repair endonuclease MutL [Desulfobulbaceae bacterium]|uniref:DNA mismatch repair protein MutL n=1 Tax=Candidatus Desulfobia pelagia TaxID=2841692 RepID=A0A8J6TFN5_9BACT|nr:DNA mismatch repair endonuclease MutL [Candidatus Desulfobia pelagia]
MSKIQILPENLANQIAAGEVVERPASVVKELVENGIDAGASHIDIQVAGGGTRLIRIIDDGVGMDQDDILLCLERHATSKLLTVEQLTSISTLGFRGEAIPSISSVSRMTITSRTESSPLGAQAELRFGQVRKVHDMGCAKGTLIEVRDLFGNVPARKKFLKTARTELSHVEEVAVNAALSHPHIGFSYSVDGRTVFSFSAGSDTQEVRVKRFISQKSDSPLIHVAHSMQEQSGVFALHGFILPPEEAPAGAVKLRLFVNSRAVRDRMINHAVAEGLHGFLMKGRRPAGVLFLEIPPADVDVNVHPTKQEIRFHKPSLLHNLVSHGVRQGMEQYQETIKYAVFGRKDPGVTEKEDSEPPVIPGAQATEFQSSSAPSLVVKEPRPLFRHGEASRTIEEQGRPEKMYSPPLLGEYEPPQDAFTIHDNEERSPHIGTLKYIGQLHDSYILCSSEDGFVVIDQHAAHERLLFETLKKQYTSQKMTGQALLFPEVIECSPEQENILQKYSEEISTLGIDISEFGGNSYVIKAVPAILSHIGPLEIIEGIFDRYLGRETKGKGEAAGVDDVLSLMACKAAVKANRELLPAEGRELLKRMEEAAIFSHCPHGRPVMKRFTRADVEKWFYR